MRLSSLLPFIIAGVVIAAAGGGSYYAILSTASHPRTTMTWSSNPLQITFPATARSGSDSDSLTCSSTVNSIFLDAKNNKPSFLTLSVTPSSFSSCGSSPDKVMITATCNAEVSAAKCRGDYTGTIRVMSPTPYNNLDNNRSNSTLDVIVTVT